MLAIVVLTLNSCAASPLQQQTIDFEGIIPPGEDGISAPYKPVPGLYRSLFIDGFRFSNDHWEITGDDDYGHYGSLFLIDSALDRWNTFRTGDYLAVQHFPNLKVNSIDGAPFHLHRFDVGPFAPGDTTYGHWYLIGNKTNGSTVESVLYTNYGRIETIEFDDQWSNLESLIVLYGVSHHSYYLGFDNFVVTRVPEPPTAVLAAVAVSLTLLGARARVRRGCRL
jgi:hypothetical protein